MGFLYILEFANGKKYIGITRQTPNEMYITHKSGIRNHKRFQLVHVAWKKYGDPTMTVLAEMHDDKLANAEINAIREYNTMNPHGYNKSPGGYLPSDEQLIASSKKLRNRKLSEETRKKMSESAKQRLFVKACGNCDCMVES